MRLSPDDKHIVWAINEAFQHNHLTKGSELKVDNVLAWQTDEWGKSVCQKQHLVVMVIKKNGTTKNPQLTDCDQHAILFQAHTGKQEKR